MVAWGAKIDKGIKKTNIGAVARKIWL